MPESSDLHTQLLDEARRYDPASHTRGLLAPYRDVILLQRAKFMSYEQISATLTRRGLKVSPAAVGCFCRRQFTKAEIDSARRPRDDGKPASEPADGAPPPARPRMPAATSAASPASRETGRRGPKIARDDF